MSLTEHLEAALAKPATTDEYDLHQPLADLLGSVGLQESDAGGRIEFTGADPVLPGALRLAGATSIALAAKSVAVAKIWQLRGGRGQDISMDLRTAPHRLCPFYDRKWELLDGYPQGDPARVDPAFGTDRFYSTADGRWVHRSARIRSCATTRPRCSAFPSGMPWCGKRSRGGIRSSWRTPPRPRASSCRWCGRPKS